ncbi:hypothetical protein BAE44_0020750 [Dichanthelium oligosanthes]|uniref:DUF309 domain-containing protein n=1 Tax=Dichanthelium oligosanthes TaxID=888268 RepID=A0A1E5UZM1_9POAL|nr:hypothetical protein BAE44_0020750 [Dichanthelium oligosanthes]
MALAPSGSAPISAGLAPTTLPAATTLSLRCYLQHRVSYDRGGSGCRARNADLRCRRRLLTARGERPHHDDEEEQDPSAPAGFDAAVALFNRGEFHACHDVVEELWYGAEDPARTLLHGILQCAVGFHHLFNQNHRGAMMELGEGLCKLRKLNVDDDHPFSRFRDEVAAVLQFLYRTQKELAACTDDLCLTMDGSPSSYQLLGNFAAGQQLYRLEADTHDAATSSIIFSVSDNRASQAAPPRVKLPMLHATEQSLTELQCAYRYM